MYINDLIKAGGRVYEVGGSVRDKVLGREVKDRDILVTGLPIETISALLKPSGKVQLVGKSFGVIKFSPHREPDTTIDIALPRKEISTGTGHREFEVKYDHLLTVEEDLGRRDFTINAMAMEVSTEKMIDPFNGMNDLKKKILRQVFPNAFNEDPLRLLRAIQFTARFGLKIEDETYASLVKNAELIKTVSAERIAEELKKLFMAKKPSIGFNIMAESGLLKHLLPQLDAVRGIMQAKQKGDDVFSHTMKVLDASREDAAIDNAGDIELMLAALLHDIGKAKTKRFSEKDERVVFFGHQIVSARMAKKILENLKVTILGVNPETVCKLIEHHMFETKAYYPEKAIRRFISKISPELILKLIDLRLADNRGGKYPDGIKGVQKLKARIIEEMNKKPPFGPKDLAVSGHDIMQLGVKEGPMVGKTLNSLVELVLDNPELNTKEQLVEIIKNMIDNADNSLPL